MKDPKFKISDIGRISKYKNNFAKGYVTNWSEEASVIAKKLFKRFTKKNCKKAN